MNSPSRLPTTEQDLIELVPFDFRMATRIVFGDGKIDQLGQLARSLNCQRTLVVSDPGIVAAGHVQRGLDALAEAGIEAHLFDGARENPSTADVERGVSIAREFRPDLLVGLGGGSSMDCAKGINFIFSNGGRMQDYWGIGKATQAMLPMIAVPTTAGTGSELQSFALISDAETHVKMACGDKKATCAIAVLDPRLTVTQPTEVTALTGIDAISHALESHVTKSRSPISNIFSLHSWRLSSCNFLQVLEDPTNLQARASMQWAAALGGLAIENSMLGACHALANPLTANFDIAHGQAIAALLPSVIRFNSEIVPERYAQLAAVLPAEFRETTDGLAQFVAHLVEHCGLKQTISELGIAAEALPQLAEEAQQQWTARHNPVPVDAESLLQIYRSAFDR